MRHRHRIPAAIIVATLSILSPACSRTEVQAEHETMVDSVEGAESAYFRFDLEQASAIYGRIWSNPETAAKDRAKAGRELARFAALFDQDLTRARELLEQAEGIEGEKVPALLMLAKIEREHGNHQRARNAAERAAGSAETPLEHRDADTEFAWAALEDAADDILRGDSDELDHTLLSEAFARVEAVLGERRGLLEPSLIDLELALILGNIPAVLAAWNSYFHTAPETEPTGLLAQPAQTLAGLARDWQGQDLDDGNRTDLVLALADSRMFEAAALLAKLALEADFASDPRIHEVIAYRDFLSAVDELTIGFYRASAAGGGNSTTYRRDLDRQAEALWPKLHWPEDPPQFSSAGFAAELDRRFGAQIEFKNANGHFGLHMGHRVIDEDYPVEQYDERATLNFIALDFMVSNGYSSWFWDGRANVGGWADNPVITQVRPAYAGSGVETWERITDPKQRALTKEKIARYESEDVELASENSTVFLPGLALRIGFNAVERVRAELEASGLESSELRLAFIAEIERLDLESSIIAHEGRHAIDARQLLNSLRRSSVKEYRAKLSEVAFSSAPFLAIHNGILARNIGDGTAHGEANQRIMKGLVEWMDQHRAALDSLDASLPLLPQLDLLSDDQLREAFRSLDPMAP